MTNSETTSPTGLIPEGWFLYESDGMRIFPPELPGGGLSNDGIALAYLIKKSPDRIGIDMGRASDGVQRKRGGEWICIEYSLGLEVSIEDIHRLHLAKIQEAVRLLNS